MVGAMASLCNVQQKIPCLFEIEVQESKKSTKWNYDTVQVSATDLVTSEARIHLPTSVITEKIDGTSCFVTPFRDKCWLWVRRDRKPTKNGVKRFKLWKKKHETEFEWNSEKDFKELPANWIPMLNISKDTDGKPLPLPYGHIPGWIPIEATSRTHCWHLSAVDLDEGLILILKLSGNDDFSLEFSIVRLNSLEGKTLELIGTNINGNPYGLGSTTNPFHVYIEHGVIPVVCDVPIESREIINWFESENGQVEGLVWHTTSGKMFKVHRYHFGLHWPLPSPKLSRHSVRVSFDESVEQTSCDLINLISKNRSAHSLPLCEFVSHLFQDENEFDVSATLWCFQCSWESGDQLGNNLTNCADEDVDDIKLDVSVNNPIRNPVCKGKYQPGLYDRKIGYEILKKDCYESACPTTGGQSGRCAQWIFYLDGFVHNMTFFCAVSTEVGCFTQSLDGGYALEACLCNDKHWCNAGDRIRASFLIVIVISILNYLI
uniref:RNA ligase 1 n=1 Tax=Strigamia maritima TaxID=126957 RepID=T1JKY1_STRMM